MKIFLPPDRPQDESGELALMWQLHSDLMAIVDAEGKFEQINPAWFSVLGWRDGNLKGKPICGLLPMGQAQGMKQVLFQAQARPTPVVNAAGGRGGMTA